MQRRRLLVGAVLLVAVLAATYAGYATLAAPDATPVHTATIASGPLEARFMASGELTVRSTTFAPPDWGMVSGIQVKEGEAVKAGQLLATLDASGMRSRYLQARSAWATARSAVLEAMRYRQLRAAQIESGVQEAEADVREGEAHLRRAYEGAEEARANLDKKRAALQGALQAKLELPILDEKVQAARTDLGIKTEDMHDASDLLKTADMRAPTDGTVSQIYLKVGDRAGPSAPVLTVVSSEEPWIEAWVDEQEAAAVKRGQAVSVRLGALGDGTSPGTVTWVAPSLEMPPRARNNARFLHIRVTFSGGLPPGARAGMAADVEGRSVLADGVTLLPRAAVAGDGDGAFVVTVSGGRAHRVAIKTGLWSADFAQEVDGPPVGTRIVVEGPETLADGERVREAR